MEYKDFFEKAKDKGITNIQVTEKYNNESSIEIIDGKIDSFDEGNNLSYDIKAEYNGKTVTTNTNYLDEEILDLLVSKSVNTDTKYEDNYLDNKEKIAKNKPLDFDISNETNLLKELDKLRIENKEINKLSTYYDESYTNTRIINSNGVDISTDSHLCSFIAEAVAKVGDDFTSFYTRILKTDKKDIDFQNITKDTIEKTILQSKKQNLETKKYDIILDSSVAGRIIENLVGMLSATSIRNKVSCLENKIDSKVFSDKLTIIEDPTNKDLPGYRLFDDEGTLTKKKTIVEKGVLKNYLFNNKEAIIKNIESTGNGYGNISTKNMYVEKGTKKFNELLSEMNDGIYITDYMGSANTSIDLVTGNISIQIFGFLIKDGKIVSGIEPSIMTTTIFELLSNIEEIGDDLTFTNTRVGSPSIYIKNISIAG